MPAMGASSFRMNDGERSVATAGLTIGDLAGFIQLAKSGIAGVTITDFDALFGKVEQLMRATNQWTAEIAANLELAKNELKANPALFEIGKADFVASVDALLAKYPATTPLSEIREFQNGNGGNGGTDEPGAPVVEHKGDIDIALIAKIFSDVQVKYDAATKTVTVEGAGYSFKQPEIDRLQFEDGVLAFDVDGNAGKLYRLYKAAFDREPDAEGLGYWVRHQDEQLSNLKSVIESFVKSDEFIERYGDEASVTNAKFVELLYTNTLGRTLDTEGYDYWLGKLNSGATNREDLLAFFADSNELKTNLAEETSNGIWFV